MHTIPMALATETSTNNHGMCDLVINTYIFLSTSMAVSCDLFVFGDLCLVTTKIIHALFGSIVCASAHAR